MQSPHRDITSPSGDTTLSTRISELKLRICPASLLHATQRAALPKISKDATATAITSLHLNLLQILRVAKAAAAPSGAGSGSFPSHNVGTLRALAQSLRHRDQPAGSEYQNGRFLTDHHDHVMLINFVGGALLSCILLR